MKWYISAFWAGIYLLMTPAQAQSEWVSLFNLPPINADGLKINQFGSFDDAEAIILQEGGVQSFFVGPLGNYQGNLFRIVRIKILKESGLNQAEVEIPYYGEERIMSIQGASYRLQNDQVVVAELKNNQIFIEEANKDVHIIKFSIPQVQVGSIIEYSYSYQTPYIHSPQPWYFQHNIPTLSSEFVILPHEHLEFTYLYLGDMQERVREVGEYHWILNDIPPLKEEAFAPNIDDFRQRMIMQLYGYVGSIGYQSVAQDWDELSIDLWNADYLGKPLRKSYKDLDALAAKLCQGIPDPKARMVAIYDYVRQHILWNRRRGISTDQKLDDIFNARQGSSAEIHLLLIYLLNAAGLEAAPLLVSTRDHGAVIQALPIYQQFNQLLACVEVGEELYVLNATDPSRPFNYLEDTDLNYRGWFMRKKDPVWLIMPLPGLSYVQRFVQITLSPEGEIQATVQEKLKGYPAFEARKAIEAMGENTYLQKRTPSHSPTFTVSDAKIMLHESDEDRLTISYALQTQDYLSILNDNLFLSPWLHFEEKEHPFSAKERTYPVDFQYPQQHVLTISLALPEGYEFETLPQQVREVLPGDASRLQVLAQQVGNLAQIRYELLLLDPQIQPEAYPAFKALYDQWLSIQGSRLVLKKKAE